MSKLRSMAFGALAISIRRRLRRRRWHSLLRGNFVVNCKRHLHHKTRKILTHGNLPTVSSQYSYLLFSTAADTNARNLNKTELKWKQLKSKWKLKFLCCFCFPLVSQHFQFCRSPRRFFCTKFKQICTLDAFMLETQLRRIGNASYFKNTTRLTKVFPS